MDGRKISVPVALVTVIVAIAVFGVLRIDPSLPPTTGSNPTPTAEPFRGWRVLDEAQAIAAVREMVDPAIAWTDTIARHTWMNEIYELREMEVFIDGATPDEPQEVWIIAFKTDDPISVDWFEFRKPPDDLEPQDTEGYVVIDDESGELLSIGFFDQAWSYDDVATLMEMP